MALEWFQYYCKKLRVGLKEFKKSYDLQRSVDATIATTVSVMKIAMISLWLANVRIRLKIHAFWILLDAFICVEI